MAKFSEKKFKYKMYVLLYLQTFVILTRIEEDTITNVHRFSCKVSVILIIF